MASRTFTFTTTRRRGVDEDISIFLTLTSGKAVVNPGNAVVSTVPTVWKVLDFTARQESEHEVAYSGRFGFAAVTSNADRVVRVGQFTSLRLGQATSVSKLTNGMLEWSHPTPASPTARAVTTATNATGDRTQLCFGTVVGNNGFEPLSWVTVNNNIPTVVNFINPVLSVFIKETHHRVDSRIDPVPVPVASWFIDELSSESNFNVSTNSSGDLVVTLLN